MSENIREWVIVSRPGARIIQFACEREPASEHGPEHGRAVTDHVLASVDGVAVYTIWADGTIESNSGDTDVVLAAIFRQAGIVDDLDTVIGIASAHSPAGCAAAERIRKAFGEALS